MKPFARRCAKPVASDGDSSMLHVYFYRRIAATLVAASLAALLAGCETVTTSIGKKIDYKSSASAPALEIPPDLTTPAYDDRFASTASGAAAARAAGKPSEILPPNPEARLVRAGRGDRRGGAAAAARARPDRKKQRWRKPSHRRRCLRSGVAAGRPCARPHRLHRRRPRPLQGSVFRALCQPGPRCQAERLARQA